jgi:hypothetical protein
MALDPALFTTVSDPLLDQTETEIFNGEFRRHRERAAALDSATQLLVPNPQFGQQPKEQAGFFSGVGQGFKEAGIAVGLGEFALDRLTGDSIQEPDPTYNLMMELEASPDRKALVQEIIDAANGGDIGAFNMYQALGNGVNPQVTNKVLQQWQSMKESRRVIEEAGLAPYITGMVGGIGLDVILAAISTGGLGGPATATRTAAGLARILSAETQMSARLLASNRLARYGAIEGAAEAGAQQLTDPAVTDTEVLIAAGLGGLGAGALGLAAPKTLGRVFTKEQLNAAEERLTKLARVQRTLEGGDSVGAARVESDLFPATVSGLPTKGSGTVIAGKILPDSIRSPKQTAADMFVVGRRLDEEDSLSGTLNFARFMNRVWKSARVQEQELGGADKGRAVALSEQLDQMQAELTTHQRRSAIDYQDMVQDIFGVGKFRSTMGNNQAFEFNWAQSTGNAIRGNAPSQEEFGHVADLYGIARGQGFLEGNEETILGILGRELSPEQKTKMLAALEKQATLDDKWWDKVFDEAVRVGMMKEEDRVAGYRPQNWNRNMILQHKTRFKNMLYEVFGGEPDADWINSRFSKVTDEATDEPLIPEGMTWKQWAEENPENAFAIADEWEAMLKQLRDEQLFQASEAVRTEVKSLGAKTVDEVLTKRKAQLSKIDAQLRKYEDRIRQMEAKDTIDVAERDELIRLYSNKELQRETVQGRIRKLDDALEEEQRLKNALRGASKDARKELRKAERKLKGLVRKGDANLARKTLTEAVESTYAKITSNESPFGFVPDDLIGTSKHFKFRSINLKDNILRKDVTDFLVKDSEHVRRLYQDTFQRQTAIRKNFGPLIGMRREDNIKDVDFLNELKAFALRSFDEDDKMIEKGGVSPKAVKASRKNRLRASEMFDRAFGEITRSDYVGTSPGFDNALRSAQAFTAASALGHVLLSLFADVAMMTMAGGRTGTGWKAFMGTRRTLRILKDIAKDDLATAMLLRGENVQDQGVFMARADLDTPTFDIPGSKWRTLARTTQNVAQLSGWANMMHVWNRWVRRSFGLDFARQIGDDLGKFDGLSDNMKEFYTRHGVGRQEAKRLSAALADDKLSRTVGDVRVPISEAWGEADWRTYQRLVRGAGNEALIDPQIGDRPFFRRNAMGRLILQFQSFMYTAGERWFAPLWQTGRLHPNETRVYTSALLALGLSVAANGVRSMRRDEGDKWMEKWGDTEGVFEHLKEGYMRSPYVFGMTGMLGDLASTQFAHPVNDAFQWATGSDFKLVNDQYVRLRQQQGIYALFGAAPGVLGSTVAMGRELAEGDVDRAAEMAAHRIPFINTLPVHGVTKLINELGD